jgi:hypothetical protein
MNCKCCGQPLRLDTKPEQIQVRKSDGAIRIHPAQAIVTCDNKACGAFSVTLTPATYADADLTPYYNVNKAAGS